MTQTLLHHLTQLEQSLHHPTQLEQSLHHPTTRRNPALIAPILATDFREFGASGSTYDKPTILALLASEPPTDLPLATSNYHLTQLSPGAALLTYTAHRGNTTTLRSSLWVLRDQRWQMLFHQGTPSA